MVMKFEMIVGIDLPKTNYTKKYVWFKLFKNKNKDGVAAPKGAPTKVHGPVVNWIGVVNAEECAHN